MSTLTLGILEPDDQEALADFLTENFGADFHALATGYVQSMFSDDFRKPTFFVAKDGAKIVASLCVTEELFTIDVFGISWVATHPRYQRRGVATALIDEGLSFIEHTAKRPVTVMLATYPDQTALYEKTGFETIGLDHVGGAIMVYYLA